MRASRINVTDIRKSYINVLPRQIKSEGCVTHNPIASIRSQTGITANHRSSPRRIAKCRRCSSGITKRVRSTKNSSSQILPNAPDKRIHFYGKSTIFKPPTKVFEVRCYSGLFISSSNISHFDAANTGKESMVVCRIRKLKIEQGNINQSVTRIICLASSGSAQCLNASPLGKAGMCQKNIGHQ